MTDRLAPIKGQLHKLWKEIWERPKARWGVVSQVTPLLILLEGETTPLAPQASCVSSVTVGQRVYCMEVERRVVVVAAEP